MAMMIEPQVKKNNSKKSEAINYPLWVEIHELKHGTSLRRATNAEIVESSKVREQLKRLRASEERIQKRIAALEKSCKHTVIYDEDGFMYDVRKCHACGMSTGLI